ncbi:MAG: hypothetical protein DRI44_02295 [Chlamydiae bacterium]|nr:MAG: hypothetical protein DRI44_02295 [Chlamydiota bacterium]
MIKNKRILISLLIFFSVIAFADNTNKTLRVATYNLENFYDRYDDPYNSKDSRIDQNTAPKPARELYALSKVIKSVNADIIVLQEVENRGFLNEFNNSYLRELKYKYVVLIEANSSRTTRGRGIDVAMLSRVPIYSATTFQYYKFPLNRKSTASFSRDFLYVKAKPEGFPELNLFVLHPISQRGGAYAHYRRIAEARGAGEVISKELGKEKNAWIIIAGDFNDSPESESLKTYLNIPGIPLKRIPAYDSKRKKFTFYAKSGGYPPSTLDHILVSKPVEKALVKPEAKIWNDKTAAIASDHRPVYITLNAPR